VRCIIAPSFGDIFFSNCFQNGVLAVQLAEAEVHAIASAAAGGRPVTVDLGAQTITSDAGKSYSFQIEHLRKEGLANGLDEIGLTMLAEPEIRRWQQLDRTNRPWAWVGAHH
jgi:3-isopropylmalate/(R)-2-methylmalate dehydratase small subunit